MSSFAQDMAVKTVHKLSLAEWNALTDQERAEKRLSVAHELNQEDR